MTRTGFGAAFLKGQHAVARFHVVVVQYPSNGPEVWELPHELHCKQGSGLNAKAVCGGYITQHGWDGTGDGTDQDAEARFRFEI